MYIIYVGAGEVRRSKKSKFFGTFGSAGGYQTIPTSPPKVILFSGSEQHFRKKPEKTSKNLKKPEKNSKNLKKPEIASQVAPET